ncbi:MAG: rhodanese-like domain-containing protein, partial [Bacteroidota bacterium]
KYVSPALAAICLVLFSTCSNAQNDSTKTELSPTEFSTQINTMPDEVLIDVRTPGEFAAGHLQNAKNIDWNGAAFESEVAQLDKEKPLLVYCQSGRRSDAAADKMRAMGFKNVLELDGGFAGWRGAGMPVAGE